MRRMSTSAASLFKNSAQAQSYALARPTYPHPLFELLVRESLVGDSGNGVAWDVGCGSGQATLAIAHTQRFQTVFGTDTSSEQIRSVSPSSCPANVRFAVTDATLTTPEQLAESLDIPPDAVKFDLITVAQAIHWFDFDAFHSLVAKVLMPNTGLYAFWTYTLPRMVTPSSLQQYNLNSSNPSDLQKRLNLPTSDPAHISFGSLELSGSFEAALNLYYKDVLDPFWHERRRYVEQHYRTIPIPHSLTEATHLRATEYPSHFTVVSWTRRALDVYLNSWSATTAYRDANHGEEPQNVVVGVGVESVKERLDASFGNPESPVLFVFPIYMRAFRVCDSSQKLN